MRITNLGRASWRSWGPPVALCGWLLLAGSGCKCNKTTTLTAVCGIAVTPATLNFGQVNLGQSPNLSLTVTNSSSGPLSVVSAEASGDSSFQVERSSSNTIPPGGSIQIQVTFNPAAAGTHSASLVITTNDSCASPTNTVTLTGVAVTYGVSIDPSQLDFGCVAIGGQSTAQTITLTNDANPAATESVTVNLSGTNNFTLSPKATQVTLVAGGSYSLSVAFSPTTLGPQTATLQISACGGDGGCPSIPVQIQGEAGDTTLVATPDPVSFSFLPVGDSDETNVVVEAQALPGSNCAFPATVQQPTLQSGDVGFGLLFDGGWDGGWPATLTPPASFPMTVTYTSLDGGGASDVAVVSYAIADAGRAPLLIPLNAQTVAGPCQLSVTPPSVSFGTVPSGQTVTRTVKVSNPGDAQCELAALAITNDADNEFALGSGTTAPLDFAPGQSTTLSVTFTTKDQSPPLSRNGTLTLTAEEIGADAGLAFSQVPLSANVTSSTCGPTSLQLSGGQSHTCALVDGGVQCWGFNGDGELGNGSQTQSLVPVSVTGLPGPVQQISTGNFHNCALVNGAALCWGLNSSGELGNGSTTSSSTPTPVSGLGSGVQSISSGYYHSCAMVNGGAQCWGGGGGNGYASYGLLGNGQTTATTTPVQVVGLTTGVQAIGAGVRHSCALVNGGVWCWGDNEFGALGNNSSANSPVPVPVQGLGSGVLAIAVGDYANCALVNDGVWCWGQNGYGELGNGTTTQSGVPVQVQGISSGVQAIAPGGGYTMCAIVGCSLLCWGGNFNGQLGDNSTIESNVPAPVYGLSSGVQTVGGAPAGFHTCAVENGTVECWGLNSNGQLGNGGTTDSPIPVPVSPWGP